MPFYHSAPHLFAFLVILTAAMSTSEFRALSVPRWAFLGIAPGSLWILVKTWIFLLSTHYALLILLLFYESERSNIQYLAQINNPAAFKLRYEYEIFQWKFREADELGMIDIEDLNGFLSWAYSTTQYAPMPSTYKNFVAGLVLVGKNNLARVYLDEAMLMYPNESVFDLYDNELSLVSAPYGIE